MHLASVLSVLTLWSALGAAAPARPVPDYQARVLGSEREVSLAKVEGVLLLNIWATWCRPCRKEMPALEAIHKRYADKGLQVIGVNVDESASDKDIAAFVQAMGVTYKIWRDSHSAFVEAFRVFGVPQTFLIADGMILRHWQGRMDPAAPENLASIKAALGLSGESGAGL